MYILYWGSRDSCVIPSGVSFLGRLANEDYSVLGVERENPYKVYLYNLEKKLAVHTGFKSPVVSRRHLRLRVSGDKVYVMDHGVNGLGSTNGSILNNELLKPGVEVEAKPGDTVRLAIIGPVFTIALAKRGYSIINVESKVPVEYPRVIASELASKLPVKEHHGSRDTMLMIIEDAEGERVVGKYIVRIYELSEEERIARTLESLQNNLVLIENYILRKEYGRARERIRGLSLRVYREVLERICGEARGVLEQLIYTAWDESVPPETILKLVRKLESLIQDYRGYSPI